MILPMFTAKELLQLLNSREFKPFAVHTTDGARYEITNHDAMMVAKNTVDIGVNHDPDGIAERIVRCAILHITRIEELEAA